MSDEDTVEQLRSDIAAITAAQREVDQSAGRLELAKEAVKEAKAEWEQRVADLGLVIRGLCEDLPLFSVTKSEPWRGIDIDQLALGTKATNVLRDADIITAGQLDEARALPGGLQSIKGVGQAMADEIEANLLDWIARQADVA